MGVVSINIFYLAVSLLSPPIKSRINLKLEKAPTSPVGDSGNCHLITSRSREGGVEK